MDLLRMLPIPVRFLVAHLAFTGLLLAACMGLDPGGDTLIRGLLVGGLLASSAALAMMLAHSVVHPIALLRQKLRECQEKDTDHVFRDRGADEIARLYKAVNDYVLYRDSDAQGQGRTATTAEGVQSPAALLGQGVGLPSLLDFTRLLALDYDFGAAAHDVLAHTNEVFKLEWSSVMVLDATRSSLTLVASAGADAALTQSLRAGARPVVQYRVAEGVSGEVIATGVPLVLNKGQKDRRFKHFPRVMYHSRKVRSMVAVPLIIEGQVHGVANFFNTKATSAFSDEHVAVLTKVAEVLSFLLAKSVNFQAVFRERLSGLSSPEYFRHLTSLEVERHRRRPGTLSLIRLALVHPEPAPDSAKRHDIYARVGGIVRQGLRKVDCATREQDTFVVCLPGTDSLGALFLAGRLKEQIDIASYEEARDRQTFTTAGGVASCPEHVSDPRTLDAAAARALDEAIRTGDSRVVCASRVTEPLGVVASPGEAP